MKFNKIDDVLSALKGAQGSQRDMRDAVREAHDFVDKRDGQWEPDIVTRMKGKPRYTDDRTNPIINQIAGELENAEFTIKVRPAGGSATKQLAIVRDGLIRNIRNLSNADAIFSQAARKMVKGGFAAWLVTHEYYDDDSFDQDLIIEPIHDAHERVWLDPDDLTNDGSDAKWVVVLHYLGKDQYEEEFPNGKGRSVGTGNWSSSYYYKPDHVTVAHFYYQKERTELIYLMSDGKVLKSDQADASVLEALEQQGITVLDQREVKDKYWCFRIFDGADWLTDEEETIFDTNPVVPVYGNFEISEGKVLYRGVVEKLMDQQRVHNYAFSRNVEEVALAPRKKIFMTPEQAKGYEKSIQSMNTNMDPVQFYNATGNVPPPFEGGASNINPAVQALADSSDQAISRSAGLFAANMGENTNLQSGVAIEKQIDRGNNGTSIYFEAMETAITRTGRILIKAIPKVYDATRQARLLKEDGSIEMVTLNQAIPGTEETVNDLSIGKYDVVCDIGAAYKNRQQEAAEMFMRAMERDPSLVQVAGDIWINNINAPGFDKIGERLRSIALNNGVIPQSQMTEEELKAAQEAAAQPKQPSAEEMAMQIQMLQAETAKMAEQNESVQHQIKMAELQQRGANDQRKLQSKLAVDGAKISQTQQRIDQEGMKVQLEAQRDEFERMVEMMRLQNENMLALSSTLNAIKDAMGADVIVSPPAAKAFTGVAQQLVDEG